MEALGNSVVGDIIKSTLKSNSCNQFRFICESVNYKNQST